MKFAGVVVLYNPDKDVLENIKTYIPFLEKLYVMDNSTQGVGFLEDIKNLDKVEYISLDGNKGIAKALKVGTERAVDDGFDILLSMDQDSKFPTEDFKYVEQYLTNNDISKLGMIAINFAKNDIKSTSDDKSDVIEVNEVITSGSFLNLQNYKQIKGYNEDLFIDMVDFDICYQFKEKDCEVKIFPNIMLNHNLGNPSVFKFLFHTTKYISHSPIRYYYTYRNYNYLRKYNSKKYVNLLEQRGEGFRWINSLKMCILEKQHLKTWKMIRKGIRDGKRGILGPFKGDK